MCGARSRSRSPSLFRLYIRPQASSGRRLFSVRVRDSDPILLVKARIQTRDRIPRDQQRLIFQGSEMEDARTLSDYNISRNGLRGDGVMCVLTLRWEEGVGL